ncbi:MAG TPA: hypothetical protein VJT67_00540 [Longimicrobiaceae bacterium]|nr:hypothetical protein [Longimicrobiaceae bacterium]
MEPMTPEERIAFINARADSVAGELGLPPGIDPREAAERARAVRQSGRRDSNAPTRAA